MVDRDDSVRNIGKYSTGGGMKKWKKGKEEEEDGEKKETRSTK